MPEHNEATAEGDKPFVLLRAQQIDPNAPKLHSAAMKRNWFAIVFGILALASNAYDASLGWNLPILSSFNRDVFNPTDTAALTYQLAQIQIANNIGGFLAPLTYIALFDGPLGRRWGVVFGTVFAFLGVCIQVFGTWGDSAAIAYLSGRVVNQFGIAIAGAVANAYIMEVSHPAWRGFFGGLFGSVWVWGMYINQFVIFIATFAPDTHWQWRVPVMIQFLWAIIIFAMAPFCPDSPRWLVAHGREEDARKMIIYWQANGDETNPMVEAQLEELREIVATAPKFRYIDAINPIPLFTTANSRRRIFILAFINWVWAVVNIAPSGGQFITVIYELVGVNNPTTKQALEIGGDVFGVVAGYFGAFGPERYGRRVLLLWGYGGAAILLGVMALGYHMFAVFNGSIGWAAVFFVGKYLNGFYNGLVTAPSANLLADELMPYENRLRTLFVLQEIGSLLNIGLSYPQAWAFNTLGNYNFYWVFGYGIFQFLTVVALYPETKGRTLEQVGEIFDHADWVRYSVKVVKENEALAKQSAEVDVKVKV